MLIKCRIKVFIQLCKIYFNVCNVSSYLFRTFLSWYSSYMYLRYLWNREWMCLSYVKVFPECFIKNATEVNARVRRPSHQSSYYVGHPEYTQNIPTKNTNMSPDQMVWCEKRQPQLQRIHCLVILKYHKEYSGKPRTLLRNSALEHPM